MRTVGVMAQCVSFASQGASAPDVLVAAPDPCSTFVLVTPAEYSALSHNPFVLSLEDGALVSGAIGTVWGIAWALRAIRSALDSDREDAT